jgi:hypothetical protein
MKCGPDIKHDNLQPTSPLVPYYYPWTMDRTVKQGSFRFYGGVLVLNLSTVLLATKNHGHWNFCSLYTPFES